MFIEGIPAKKLTTNAFRGLSFCKHLYFSNSYIEYIEANAFYRANNIDRLSLMNSRIKSLHADAFRGIFNIGLIDLRGNYITKVSKATFEPLLPLNENTLLSSKINDSITMIVDSQNLNKNSDASNLISNNKYLIKKILFEQNPIECDCDLEWILKEQAFYLNYITLPELCAGPKGYDCLRISELQIQNLACPTINASPNSEAPCDDIEFIMDNKNQISEDIFSIQASKAKIKHNPKSDSTSFSDLNSGDEENQENLEDYSFSNNETNSLDAYSTDESQMKHLNRPNKLADKFLEAKSVFKTTTQKLTIAMTAENKKSSFVNITTFKPALNELADDSKELKAEQNDQNLPNNTLYVNSFAISFCCNNKVKFYFLLIYLITVNLIFR
jgi:hypothetical protein